MGNHLSIISLNIHKNVPRLVLSIHRRSHVKVNQLERERLKTYTQIHTLHKLPFTTLGQNQKKAVVLNLTLRKIFQSKQRIKFCPPNLGYFFKYFLEELAVSHFTLWLVIKQKKICKLSVLLLTQKCYGIGFSLPPQHLFHLVECWLLKLKGRRHREHIQQEEVESVVKK